MQRNDERPNDNGDDDDCGDDNASADDDDPEQRRRRRQEREEEGEGRAGGGEGRRTATTTRVTWEGRSVRCAAGRMRGAFNNKMLLLDAAGLITELNAKPGPARINQCGAQQRHPKGDGREEGKKQKAQATSEIKLRQNPYNNIQSKTRTIVVK